MEIPPNMNRRGFPWAKYAMDGLRMSDWWFGTWILFSISYMWCHPSHWRTHIFPDCYCTTNQLMFIIFPFKFPSSSWILNCHVWFLEGRFCCTQTKNMFPRCWRLCFLHISRFPFVFIEVYFFGKTLKNNYIVSGAGYSPVICCALLLNLMFFLTVILL